MTFTYNISNIDEAAATLLEAFPNSRFFAFWGGMGAGKTTLTKALCKHLGVDTVVTSPTFAIVNEYVSGTGEPIFHFDFYRIKNLDEARDIGCDDYFYSGCYCFCEWSENIEPLLPDDCVRVVISGTDQTRTIEASVIKPKLKEKPFYDKQ
ncbi:MAG: tRNA (adenosine(37)-N6)-threonylcarbamoyltransferase complex ATPase subunit type 1 TsaE [Bacteroidales bacterium]|nr:tRNA (adenosine(37)-N6)-threonylcarbamoyltransferase complex ATPase subunit type 1 TsaE [Bacteroidales bacterium]